MTTLLNDALRAQLLANRLTSAEDPRFDPLPVVKLFTPNANATWLLSELDAGDIAFGLCDLGLGFPELGYVSLTELEASRGRWGLPIERDVHFAADKPLSVYAREELRDLRGVMNLTRRAGQLMRVASMLTLLQHRPPGCAALDVVDGRPGASEVGREAAPPFERPVWMGQCLNPASRWARSARMKTISISARYRYSAT